MKCMGNTYRNIAVAVFAAAALTMTLGGCSGGGGNATNEIINRLDTMQQELDDLKADTDAGSSTLGSQNGSGSQNGNRNGNGTSSSTPTDSAGFDTAISDLEQRVSEAVSTANAVSVPSNAADRPQAYFDATKPLETLDDEVDRLDDQIESAHRAGTLDRNALWSLEQRLDAVDGQLDQAKDSLEHRMGVDD